MKKLLLIILLLPFTSFSQPIAQHADTIKGEPQKTSHWYNTISVRGYMQFRYNRFLETNPELKCESCDKSWGKDGGLFIRRMRLIFYGQIHERVFIYIQPDFGSAVQSSSLNFGQLRDAYMDLGLDKKNEFRVRLGQSKIPYGVENMQSSQSRLTLDRDDAINSALPNERDIAALFYWAPAATRKTYAQLVSDGLKGSGDYGVFGFGVFNGQTLGKPELNNELHVVTRLSYPFKIGRQIIEPSLQAYTGRYVLSPEQISSGVKVKADRNYLDQRAAASFVLYPKPFGIQAEYNTGRGPEFNKATDSIELKNITGGYILLNYFVKYKKQNFYPFLRMQYYAGGKKNELDARSYNVHELEAGMEWQPIRNFELTAQYTISKRRFEDFKNQNNLQSGSLLRLQAQVNF